MGGRNLITGRTATTFAFLGELVNAINRTNFGTDLFRGFRSVKGRKRPFLIFKQDVHNNVLRQYYFYE